MPKGTKSTKFELQPMNGMRAIKGQYGQRKNISIGQYKETEKKCNLENQQTSSSYTYLKNIIQIEKKENLQIENKE